MKLSKTIKILVIMLLLALITIFASQFVMAEDTSKGIDPLNADDSLTDRFSRTDESGASKAASNIIGMIINIAQVIGMGVAIIMLVVLAIQYIAASPEGKAEIKKNSTIYIVGAVILFAASGILSIIRRFAITSIGKQGDDQLGETE